MIINHPLLGPRDSAEFVCLGDAELMIRPDWQGKEASGDAIEYAIEKFHEYLYLRDNPAGEHKELWYHEQGDRSWLVLTRNTLNHEIKKVELARDVARGLIGSGEP
jgi:heterotetrameric sarcosine oxidase delta subunit